MFRAQNMVPDYYIEKSRDFQVLCRLYDFNFNALKYNIDSSGTLTDTRAVKDTFLPLVGDKFGIYDEKSYANRFLLESLPAAVKNKGSLKSIGTLLNAFLDSMGIFEYVLAYSAKDEESAEEISFILNRDVKPYTIVIVLSQYPGLTDLNILKEYMNMVIPTGMNVEYMFAVQKYTFDKFKYNEHVFLFYVNDDNVTTSSREQVTTHFPRTGFIYNTNDKYEVGNVVDDSYFNRRVIQGGGKNAYEDTSGFEINVVGIATVSTDEGRSND